MVNMLEFKPLQYGLSSLSQKDPIYRGLSMFIPFHVFWMAQVGSCAGPLACGRQGSRPGKETCGETAPRQHLEFAGFP